MSSAIILSRTTTRTAAFLVLLNLLTWFAAPEAQSYTPNFAPNSHLAQEVLVQLELVKHNVDNQVVKHLVSICHLKCEKTESTQPIKRVEIFPEEALCYRNYFYINPTTNAP